MQRKHLLAALFASILPLTACGGGDKTPAPLPTPVPYQYHLYVSESGLNRVEALDPTTGKSLGTIPVGTQPTMMVYDHHTQNTWDNYNDPSTALWVLNAGSASVTRIDPRTNKATITISVGGSPVDIAAAQNTSHLLYVADGQSNSVAIIDENSNSIVGHIATAARPFQLSTNGSILMIAETNNSVELVDDSKPSTVPITTITTQSPLMGVGTYYDTDPAIETADGLLHIYKAQPAGGLPWSIAANYKLPHGAGQLEARSYYNYMVINAGSKLVQYISFDPNDNTVEEHDMATGSQPGFGSELAPNDNGYFYIPNAGGDSLSVYWRRWQPFATWPLASGAHPIKAVGVQFVSQSASSPSPSPKPTVTPTVSPTNTPTPTPGPTATPTTGPSASGHLFVANGSGGNLLEYTAPFSASSTPVSMQIGGNIWGVAANNSYVAVEDSNGYILMFAQPFDPNASPVAQFQAGSNGGQLAFDSHGNLFSTTLDIGVLEFSPPFSSGMNPTATITGSSASFSIAFDASDNMYVGNLGQNEIDVFTPPYTGAPTKVMQPGTYSLAYYQNALYGADAMNNAVDLYSLPLGASSRPVFTIPVTDPHALAFDNAGNLYAADQTDKAIRVFTQPFSGSSTPAFSMTSGVVEPVEMNSGP